MGFKKAYNSIHNLHMNVKNRYRSQTNLTNFHTVPNPKDKTNIHVKVPETQISNPGSPAFSLNPTNDVQAIVASS
jgi:hypothetical protein